MCTSIHVEDRLFSRLMSGSRLAVGSKFHGSFLDVIERFVVQRPRLRQNISCGMPNRTFHYTRFKIGSASYKKSVSVILVAKAEVRGTDQAILTRHLLS